MKVLFTVLGDHPQPTRDARRHIGYERLVVFTHRPDSDKLQRIQRMEDLTGDDVEVVTVDPTDPLGTLHRMEEATARHREDDVRFQVNARDNRLTHPALLCCFQHGIEAWFCHEKGAQRLPVLQTVDLVERFPSHERLVLEHLDEPTGREVLAAELDLPRTRVLDALLGLKDKGLLDVDGDTVALNDGGRYYRNHVLRAQDEDPSADTGDPDPDAATA